MQAGAPWAAAQRGRNRFLLVWVEREKAPAGDVSPKPSDQPVNIIKFRAEFSKWKQTSPQRCFQALFLLARRREDDPVFLLSSQPGGTGHTRAASRFSAEGRSTPLLGGGGGKQRLQASHMKPNQQVKLQTKGGSKFFFVRTCPRPLAWSTTLSSGGLVAWGGRGSLLFRLAEWKPRHQMKSKIREGFLFSG